MHRGKTGVTRAHQRCPQGSQELLFTDDEAQSPVVPRTLRRDRPCQSRGTVQVPSPTPKYGRHEAGRSQRSGCRGAGKNQRGLT